jgi:hypothetical protein
MSIVFDIKPAFVVKLIVRSVVGNNTVFPYIPTLNVVGSLGGEVELYIVPDTVMPVGYVPALINAPEIVAIFPVIPNVPPVALVIVMLPLFVTIAKVANVPIGTVLLVYAFIVGTVILEVNVLVAAKAPVVGEANRPIAMVLSPKDGAPSAITVPIKVVPAPVENAAVPTMNIFDACAPLISENVTVAAVVIAPTTLITNNDDEGVAACASNVIVLVENASAAEY